MRLITPEEREVKSSRSSGLGISPRDEAIREKHLTPYVHLECGHVTTREEIEQNSLWQTKRSRYYCCNCGSWRNIEKRRKPPPLPDEPMF